MKTTILDKLTSPTVTPDILRSRAGYWRVVADRHVRADRIAQADRLRVNCDAMEQQAAEMETSRVVTFSAKRRRKGALAIADTRYTFKGYADFQAAYLIAKQAALRVCGERWYLDPQACIKARVPPSWVSCVILGRPSRTPRDLNFPAAEFWPRGALPYGPQYAEPPAALRPLFTLTSLVSGKTVELHDIELAGFICREEAISRKTMKHPRINAPAGNDDAPAGNVVSLRQRVA
jgi:hypothetical protein